MLGSQLAETLPVNNNFWLAAGRLRTSRSVTVAGCASQMGQQKNVKSKLFRKSRPQQPAGPSTVCVVAEAWQRMHRAEVRMRLETQCPWTQLGKSGEVTEEVLTLNNQADKCPHELIIY